MTYPAALAFLTLTFEPKQAKSLVKRLRKAGISKYEAKDLFRASGLPLLGGGSFHVERDRQKILAQTALSPLLLVRAPDLGRLVVADGYHRLCAVYTFDEDAIIPCKIV